MRNKIDKKTTSNRLVKSIGQKNRFDDADDGHRLNQTNESNSNYNYNSNNSNVSGTNAQSRRDVIKMLCMIYIYI